MDVVWWSTKELPDQAEGFSFALRTRGNTESSKRRADRSDLGLARPRQAYRYNTYKQIMSRSETRYQNYKETKFAEMYLVTHCSEEALISPPRKHI